MEESWACISDNAVVWETSDVNDPLFDSLPGKTVWRTRDQTLEWQAGTELPEDERWRFKRFLLYCLAPIGHTSLQPELGVLTFGSTSFKVGRKMYKEARFIKKPLFGQVWGLGIKKNEDWFVPDPKFKGMLPDTDWGRETYNACAAEWAKSQELKLTGGGEDSAEGLPF